MILKDWIAKVGDEAAAIKLGVSVRTAQSYRIGARVPRSSRVREIARITGGQVAFKDCFPPIKST